MRQISDDEFGRLRILEQAVRTYLEAREFDLQTGGVRVLEEDSANLKAAIQELDKVRGTECQPVQKP